MSASTAEILLANPQYTLPEERAAFSSVGAHRLRLRVSEVAPAAAVSERVAFEGVNAYGYMPRWSPEDKAIIARVSHSHGQAGARLGVEAAGAGAQGPVIASGAVRAGVETGSEGQEGMTWWVRDSGTPDQGAVGSGRVNF